MDAPTPGPDGGRQPAGATHELTVDAGLIGVRRARGFARQIAGGITDADDLELLVAELVTNAVLHGAPPVVLRLETLPDRVRIAVTDASPRLPLAGVPETGGLTGRGLGIVEALSTEWGVVPQLQGGKVVWADVAPPPQLPGRSPAKTDFG